MKLRLLGLYDALTDSFWFLPALMAMAAGGAALGSVALDHKIGSGWVKSIGWVWSGGADGARSVLSVVAGSVMTVVSIVFSLTISALAQTSSHFGPRVLRNFTSDRAVQFTLGTFISTFVYCLLVLRTVRSVEELSFVPYLSVNLGVGLALASLAVLIFFIHHISQSIQAENLIAAVGYGFERALTTLLPERIGENRDGEAPDEAHWQHAAPLSGAQSGYLQRVDEAQLIEVATRHDLQIRLHKRPGEFAARGARLLEVGPPSRLSEKIERDLRACFRFGPHRTPHQDALYALQQLVEIAAHALSPGINEPFTALTCIDWIGASLRGVLTRDLPSPLRHDENGKLRVVARCLSFDELASAAFDPIRLYGASNPDIMAALLEVIGELCPDSQRETDREVLQQQAQWIGADAAQIVNEADRARVMTILQKTQRVLAEKSALKPKRFPACTVFLDVNAQATEEEGLRPT